MNRLTDDEWIVTGEPFSFLRAIYSGWSPKHRYIVSTWLEDHGTGWFYESDQAVIFERSDDALAFKIWITSDPFGLSRPVRPQVADAMAMLEIRRGSSPPVRQASEAAQAGTMLCAIGFMTAGSEAGLTMEETMGKDFKEE